MTITIPNHGFMEDETIKIGTNSLVFTCLQDVNQTNHAYPRSGDPVNNKWIPIKNVTDDTFDVHVLDNVPSSNQTLHTLSLIHI